MDLTNLKKLRKEKKLPQIQVAKTIGVCLATYQLWENGGGNPSPENFEKLKKFFDLKDKKAA